VVSAASLAKQTTPGSFAISDTASRALNPEFVDLDLDAEELGGTISWELPPAKSAQVSQLGVYLAMSPIGSGRSLLGLVDDGSYNLSLPANTARAAFLYVLIYTKSSLVEQTTPTVAEVNDTSSSVGALSLIDKDLDLAELGGYVTWSEPDDATYMLDYLVYLALGAEGQGRSRLGSPMSALGPEAAQQSTLLPNSPLGNFTQVLVYTRSSLAEQSSPTAQLISDAASLLSGVNFADKDLDGDEIGGTLLWTLPGDTSQLQGYLVYLASSEDGLGNRSHVGSSLLPLQYRFK
jgi:hypothetical protein